jgi:hypothetical protein
MTEENNIENLKEEPRTTEVIHSIKYAEEPVEEVEQKDVSPKLEGVDLDDNRAIAEFYMAKSGQINPDDLEVEKKERELREDIREVVENKEELIDYLTNLHASIEVMEERIYELELRAEKKERASIPMRPSTPGGGSALKGLSNLPFGIL